MSTPISTGNILRYFTGCPCGRGWETEAPLDTIPAHEHNHQLLSGAGIHTCTECTWTVETYTNPNDPATAEAVRKAFAKHLLLTTLEATA